MRLSRLFNDAPKISPTRETEIETVSKTAVEGITHRRLNDNESVVVFLITIVELVTYRGIPSGRTRSFCSIASPAKFPIAVTLNNYILL